VAYTYLNFAQSLVATAPSPATSGTSLVVSTGDGALFSNGYCVAWPPNVQPTKANAEIVLITGVSTDTITMTRAQEGTTAQSIAVGWNFDQNVTAAFMAQFMVASTYDPAAIAQQVVGTTATQTLTNKRITKRTLALSANSATPAIDTDNYDVVHITAQTAAITSLTSGLTGTPVDGDTLRISITGTAAVAITWGTSFESSTVTLPTTTVTTARLDIGFFWNTETSKWRCMAVA